MTSVTDKFRSSYIYFDEEARPTFVDLPVYVGSVPTEHLQDFDSKLKESLRKIARDGFDMERMAMVISRDQRQVYICSDFQAQLSSAKTIIASQQIGEFQGRYILLDCDNGFCAWSC